MKILTKTAMIALVVFIASANIIYGQKPVVEKWLPVSSKIESAVNAYHEGLIRSGHNDEPAFAAKIDEAIKDDPQFFMAHAVRAWMNPSEIPSVLSMPTDKLNKAELLARDVLKEVNNNPQVDLLPFARKLTEEFPNTLEAYFFADFMMFRNNDWKNAYTFSKKMVELDPTFSTGYHWLGYSYLRTDYIKLAGEAFEKYALLAPEEAKPYEALGEYYLNTGDMSKAAENFEKAVALGRESSKYDAEKTRALSNKLNFSPEQKEVWQAVENYWKCIDETNTKAFAECLHDNYSGLNNFMLLPINKQEFIGSLKYYKTKSYSIKPISVNINGNTALVSYTSSMDYGKDQYIGKHVEFYVKENGKWLLLGDNVYVKDLKEKPSQEI